VIKRAFAATLFPDSLQSIFVGTAEIFRLADKIPVETVSQRPVMWPFFAGKWPLIAALLPFF
jgi:hypothetical protein